jgi:uncharacterized protein (TIGR02246 family)
MTLKLLLVSALLAAPLAGRAACGPDSLSADDDRRAILGVIDGMEAAWNRGDFKGYMAGFLNPDVVFVSRGHIQSDWQGTLDHYVRDYGASDAARGQLHFHDICIQMLAPDAAQLISHYDLAHPDRTEHGVNTRLMRKLEGRWVIALNHVSTSEPTLNK